MESVFLTANIEEIENVYVARVDDLELEAIGESWDTVQDELIQVVRGWIDSHDGTDTLSDVLAAAGYPGVDEETELQLEFMEAALPADGV